MQIGARTLQRRLNDWGISFEEMLDDIRKNQAMKLLEGGNASVLEIAYLVGYSDPAHLTRAFRRWTGVSPRSFRSATRIEIAITGRSARPPVALLIAADATDAAYRILAFPKRRNTASSTCRRNIARNTSGAAARPARSASATGRAAAARRRVRATKASGRLAAHRASAGTGFPEFPPNRRSGRSRRPRAPIARSFEGSGYRRIACRHNTSRNTSVAPARRAAAVAGS